ncbi:MAG TPA: hypothetical protein VGF67_04575 [Ktedonobacteraceae bacterium]|jgi:SRSO17 transposase
MTQARSATTTVAFIDAYCQLYQEGFPDVRSFEHWKQRPIGMLAEIKRKTLPAIARAVRDGDPQALHHLGADAPWHVEPLREERLKVLKQALAGRTFPFVSTRQEMRTKARPRTMSLVNLLAISATWRMESSR